MNCVKCGKETVDSNVFCEACLADMERYPVKPGTKVHIPPRPEPVERKQTRLVKERTPEEQITSLHKLVQILVISLAGLATVLMISVGVLVYVLADDVAQEPERVIPMRRNYSTSAPASDE